MRIGVDVDNTLNNFSQSIARYLDPLVMKDTEQLLKEHLWISNAVGWSDEKVVDFFARYGERIHGEAGMKDKYVEIVIKGLYLRKFNMKIITNRQSERVGFDVETQTHEWLKKHKIDNFFTGVHFVKDCKHEYSVATSLNIECMVEDNLERSIPFLENGIPVVLFNHPYNHKKDGKAYTHKNLHRVNNWWEAYQALVTIEREVFNKGW